MRRSTLVLGIAVFAVGIVLGWWIGHRSGGEVSPAPTDVRPSHADPVPQSQTAKVPSAPTVHAPVVDAPLAPSAASAAPAQREGTAGDTIHGSVVGTDGRPVAEVLVRATPFERPEGGQAPPPGHLPPGSPPPRIDVMQAVRDYARRLALQQAGVRETTTDPSGNYALSGLSSKMYRLGAWRAGFQVERAGGRAWAPVKTGSRCDFLATPIRRVVVSVTLPDGKPPERAVISWAPTDTGSGGSAEWSPAEPGIEVPPGSYSFTAWAGPPGETLWAPDFVPGEAEGPDPQGEALYRSPSQTAMVDEVGGKPLELRLEARPGIQVTVTFEGTRRPRSVRVAACRLEGATAGDPSLLLAQEGLRERWLDESPQGTIGGLEPGSYLVGATFRGGRVGATATVSVGLGLTPVDLRIPDIDPMEWIRVVVLDPDGQPARDAQLECGCRGSEESASVKVAPVPEADGSYRVEHYAKGASIQGGGWNSYWQTLGDGPYSYFVRATSARYGTVVATYNPEVDREVTLQFAAPALLRAVIPGFATNPRRDRAVLELEWAGERRDDCPDLKAPIDTTGTARFPPAVPGPYEVVLRLAAGSNAEDLRTAGWTGTTVARTPLTLPSGETTVSVPLPVYSDLTVTFDGDAPRLQFIGPDGVPDRWEEGVKENGAVTFRNQPEGRYRLWDPRRGAMRVDLPASGPITFLPTPFDALLLEVTGDGYFRDLGLQTGDLVVRIEGSEFRDRDSMDKAMATAMVRGTARLTIQRGAATFEVTVEVREFMEDEGSDLEPWVR